MASKGMKLKKLPFKRKAYLFGIISFFAFILGFGIKAAYAYYSDSASLSILANKVGDFDTGNGDINLMIYKETEKDTNIFTRSYAVPAVGYSFNASLTKCYTPCDNDPKHSCSTTCSGTDETASCYYKYDEKNKSLALTSTHKVTCKFYFEEDTESDITVYVMKEDVAGTYNFSPSADVDEKTYSVIESIPAYGYKYVGYECDNPVEALTYNSEKKKFNVSTKTKNVCYAYFDQSGSADIVANVFVQSSAGSTAYKQVESIPANQTYKLSTYKNSYCYNTAGVDTGATITYEDGYINITASGKQTCDVYLDLTTE